MERLTERLNNLKKGVSQMGDKEEIKVNKFFLKNVCKYLEQLKSYKDAEEQGLLLRLPCKVGTQVWKIKECSGGEEYQIVPIQKKVFVEIYCVVHLKYANKYTILKGKWRIKL